MTIRVAPPPPFSGGSRDPPVSCCACLNHRCNSQTTDSHTCRDRGYRHHGCPFRGPGGHGELLSGTSTPTRLPLPSDRVSTLLGNVPLPVSPVYAADADHASRREPCDDERHVADLCHWTVPFSGSFETPCGIVGSYFGTLTTNRGDPGFASLLLWRNVTLRKSRGLG